MKKLLVLAVLMSGNLMAGEKILLTDSKEMDVEVSRTTVRCSALGYGQAELKINIKNLDGWTILDHTNVEFGDFDIPCMTAGRCKRGTNGPGFSIEDVIQGTPRVEKIVVNRELKELKTLETVGEFSSTGGKLVCTRRLLETLDTVVGGVQFKHTRSVETNRFEKNPEEVCK